MNRFTVVTATALALATAVPLLATTSTSAFAQGPRDEMSDRELLELFVDRFRARREMREMFEERVRDRDRDGDVRERFRERALERRDRDRDRDNEDDDDDDDRGARSGGHLRERIAHFRRGRGGGGDGCYFVTRSVRSAGGDFFALTRRRICRD